ncbi:MAG: radical SAM protein [bacterium]|nr:radical SAM protein [bacterium]MCX8189128.1 radical SAM protein [Nitrososphaeria archaeon]
MMLVRASIGSLAELDLINVNVDAKPTTCYLLQYSGKGCTASCLFCPQSSSNIASKELVSRIPWPVIELETLANKIEKDNFSRICLQTVLKEDFEKEAIVITRMLNETCSHIPISIGTIPVSEETLHKFYSQGVDCIGVGLDVASGRIFEQLKRPFKMDDFWNFIKNCIKIFNHNHVYVHLIYGLGESDIEFALTMEKVYDAGAEVALFSFTPVKGTPLEHFPQPKIEKYRLMQIIRYFLNKNYKLKDIINIEENGLKLKVNIEVNEIKTAFLTTGCPACNRPFYNERPTKIYNYPSSALLEKEFEIIRYQIKKLLM